MSYRTINFTTLASGALGFTLALAWNDAVSKTIKSFFPPTDEKAAARATLVYALVITILVIFLVAVINQARRWAHKNGRGAEYPPAGARQYPPPMWGDRQHQPPPMQPGGGQPAPPDCQACAEHCGTAPIVHLWEPTDR